MLCTFVGNNKEIRYVHSRSYNKESAYYMFDFDFTCYDHANLCDAKVYTCIYPFAAQHNIVNMHNTHAIACQLNSFTHLRVLWVCTDSDILAQSNQRREWVDLSFAGIHYL